MSVAAEPVRLEFADYVHYTETHPDGAFELLDGVIFKLAPEGDGHLTTRSGIHRLFMESLDLGRYNPWTEASFPAPGWPDGPRPDNFVSRGPWRGGSKYAVRPTAEDIALVVEVSSNSRPKDRSKAKLYARLRIPEYWLVDLVAGVVVVYHQPAGEGDLAAYVRCQEFGPNESITSTAVDRLSIETNYLLEFTG